MIREPDCTRCPLSAECNPTEVCVVPRNAQADVLVVTRSPLTDRAAQALSALLAEAGITSYATTSAIKCRAEADPSRADIKACRYFLELEIEKINPQWILTLGNEALYSAANRSGVMKYRGHVLERPDGRKIVPTVNPSIIGRYPGMRGGLLADLRYFHSLVSGDAASTAIPEVGQVVDMFHLRLLRAELERSVAMSFDVETTGFDEFLPDSRLISIGFTLEREDGSLSVWSLALYHPESPFYKTWKKALAFITPAMEAIPKAIAHNGKFDCRWLRQFGNHTILTFDTMLAAGLLDENRPKGLKGLAQQLLGAVPWNIDSSRLLESPLEDVLVYNGLDTYYTHLLWKVFRKDLAKQPRLARLFLKLIMPCSEVFTDIEREGIWIDQVQLQRNLEEAERILAGIDEKIMEYVPDDHGFKEINFNPSNFLRWLLFEHLGLPVIARGKTGPSLAEAVLLELKEEYDIAKLLLERARWQKIISGFLRPYTEMVDENSRIHTTFKLAGTVTGRLASGKPEQDQVVGRTKSRGINLQQVPRDSFVRGLFGAPPGWAFIEFDFSQIELRIAAFLAQERNMLHLYATGQDLHMAMAQRMTGKPANAVSKDERKKAKAVNFGFLYGMGASKFQVTAFTNYGVHVTEKEAFDARTAFFQQYPDLRAWHGKQKRLVNKYGRVESPIGRVRHLPDIYSSNETTHSEAERQAINSPVQSFGSDLALIALIRLRRLFKERGYKTFPVGTVHDAINFQAPISELPEVLPLIKKVMENPPLRKWFGIDMNVPIVADAKVGSRWGFANEVPGDIVSNPHKLREWIDGQDLPR